MSGREEQFTDRSRFPWIVCFLVLPIVYVLGIGPAAWVYHVVEPPEPIGAFLVWVYRPLEWVFESADPLSGWFYWYIKLWLP